VPLRTFVLRDTKTAIHSKVEPVYVAAKWKTTTWPLACNAEQRDIIIRSVLIEIGGIAMKQNLYLIATLALAAALSPAAFAQQGQTTQPGSNEPQTQNTPAPDTPADTQTQSFSGTIVKTKNHYVLKTDRMTYQLDDETKAKQFEGKQVNVSGTVDKSTSVIRVTDIQPAS
jgi:Protein of unknown function (DUF5818)